MDQTLKKLKNFFVNCLNHDLELTIQCNKKVANFVGVTEFRKLNIPYLPKRQQQNHLCQHWIQSSAVHNQTAAKINRIKIIPVICKWKNIQELSHKVFLAGETSQKFAHSTAWKNSSQETPPHHQILFSKTAKG